MSTNSNAAEAPVPYGFGPLVTECARRGIGRTVAFELARRGLIDTFVIGKKRMVKIASLESLPDRLQQQPAPRAGRRTPSRRGA